MRGGKDESGRRWIVKERRGEERMRWTGEEKESGRRWRVKERRGGEDESGRRWRVKERRGEERRGGGGQERRWSHGGGGEEGITSTSRPNFLRENPALSRTHSLPAALFTSIHPHRVNNSSRRGGASSPGHRWWSRPHV